MIKNLLITAGMLLVTIYLCLVVLCNIEHAKKTNDIQGMNPCGSCWALKP